MKKWIILSVIVIICGVLFAPYYSDIVAMKKLQQTESTPNGQITTMEQAKAQFLNSLEQAKLTVEQTKGLHNSLSARRRGLMGLVRMSGDQLKLYNFVTSYKSKMSKVDYDAFLDFALENTQIYSTTKDDYSILEADIKKGDGELMLGEIKEAIK